MALDKPYKNIPGTTIFDAELARRGYHLNQFCMSLMKAENRARFKADERAYLDGRAIGKAVALYDEPLKVQIWGTGGMSHQLQGPRAGLINREWDNKFLARLIAEPEQLADVPHLEYVREAGSEGIEACQELGVALVAFSPVGRGFLAGGVMDPRDFAERDIRRSMPRFQPPHFGRNRQLLDQFNRVAWEAGCTPAQLALAWLLSKAPHVLPIVGTTSLEHLQEDVAASKVRVSAETLESLERLINADTVSGPRYAPETLVEIDTESTPHAG